jgi:SAM-dependent methyltransferase
MNSEPKVRPDQIGVSDRSVGRVRRAIRFASAIGLSGTIQLIRKYGFRESYRFVVRNIRFAIAVQADKRFDRAHGVDTGGSIQLDSLNIRSPNRGFGTEYVSTSAKSFAWMMRALPSDLSGYVFIDIGAGKGRALLLASQYRFSRIVGVEFARELVAIARNNIERFNRSSQANAIEIVETDAVQYKFPPNPLVVYFYNPFSPKLFAEVLNALVETLRSNPRNCFIIYATTMPTMDEQRKLILASGAFQELETDPMPLFWDAVRSIRYMVFKTRNSTLKS